MFPAIPRRCSSCSSWRLTGILLVSYFIIIIFASLITRWYYSCVFAALDCLVRATEDTVNFASSSHSRSSSSKPRRPSNSRSDNSNTSFADFVLKVVTRSEVTIGVLLVALVYIHRARPHLSIGQDEWALEQVFLGALILAAKVCLVFFLLSDHLGC
jgi:Cyclin, N-terminal domain